MRPTLLVWMLVGLVACQAPQRFEFAEPHLGSEVRLVLYAADPAQAAVAGARAFQRIAELEAVLSDYREDSELRRLCDAGAAGDGTPHPVRAELFELLRRAAEVSRRTDGAFDVTVGPLVQLWRRSVRQQELPAAARLEEARRRVGYESLRLDPEARTVAFTRPGMRLDTGGIGKGFVADAVLRELADCGIRRALVDAGGDVAVSGSPPVHTGWPGREGWRVRLDGTEDQVLLLRDAAVATSGDRYQFLEVDGVRYSHVVDPRTGLGSTARFSATVVAPDGALADALASALCVLGPDGLALVEDWPGVEARVVQGTPPVRLVVETSGFAGWVLASRVDAAR